VSDRDHLIRYLKKQHVLSVCTGSGEDLWCANCYYVFNEARMAFWLMTETDTRHGALMLMQTHVAGTISGQPKSILLIKGVQYRGRVHRLSDARAAAALQAYQKRFPVAKKVSAPLWEIALDELKMTDNALGFGHKIVWRREEQEELGRP